MAELKGTLVASRIVPSDSQDTYATHEALYGKGGHRSVSSIAERDAIPADRREVGMSVYVSYVDELAGSGKYFLKGGITNSHWELEESNSGINQATLEELDKKVDKEEGKQLSQENFTTAFMQKLSQLDNNFKGYFLTEEQIAEAVENPAMGNYVLVKLNDSSTVFFYDGTEWKDTGSSSLGDMMAVIYDPSGIAGDVFDVDNMVESLTRKFMTAVERAKLEGIEAGAQVNTITSVNGKTGEVTLDKSDIGLNNVDNTPDNTKKVAEAAKTTYKLKIGNVEFDGSHPIEVEIPDALPEILESDVGKVLTVNEEGETEWKTPTGGGGSGTGEDGKDGKSAYELAKDNGFEGTIEEWLESLDGSSAYELALANGFVGTVEEWLLSLHGKDGSDGTDNLPNYTEEEAGKVLTVAEDGVLAWKTPTGGSGGGYFTGTAGITVGGITAGDIFTDVPVTEMINNLINPELNPNLTNPNNALTSTVSGLREIGTTISPRLTATFNRGTISPQYSASEPYRAGLPTKYVFTSTAGLNQEIESNATTYGIDVPSFEVVIGTVTFSSNISYSAGPQPTTSKGNVFDNPLPAGTTGNKTVTITGVYPCYNGISALTKMTLANHGGTITVDAPADMNVGGDRFKIQYPTVWSAKTPIVQQENELSKAWDNQNMSEYSITTIDKNGVSYKQVEYIGAGIGARKLRLVF